MYFEIVLTRQAEKELAAAAEWISEQSQNTAISEQWFNRFVDSLRSLNQFPSRCSLARENHLFPIEIRQLFFGRRRTYRALFTIQEQQVIILTIRHTALPDVQPDDVEW